MAITSFIRRLTCIISDVSRNHGGACISEPASVHVTCDDKTRQPTLDEALMAVDAAETLPWEMAAFHKILYISTVSC